MSVGRGCAVLVSGLLASALIAPMPAAAQPINILTGGTGGVYYPIGVALAGVYREAIPGSRPAVQATKASVENLTLLHQGRGEVAFTLGDSLMQAWNGDLDAGFRSKLDRLRTIAAIYPNYVQIVATRASGIRSLGDLKGKRLSVGAPKSGTELNARTILSAAGLRYEDLGRVEYQPFSASVEMIKHQQLDATLQSAGLGVASIRELASAMDTVIVDIPLAIIDKIGPPYGPGIIPAGTYAGQTADVATACIPNFLVTHAELSEDLVYALTKALFEHLPKVGAAHPAAKSITLEQAPKGSPIPLHPGAARFYREKGLSF